MSVIVEITPDGPCVIGARLAPPERTPNAPANGGHGDARKKIVPVVKPASRPSAEEWEGGRYASLQEWLAGDGRGAVLLQPGDDARVLAGKLSNAALVAVDFHRIGDGRGYTHAFLLRNRLGYTGRLRALGAVTADQALALTRVGFDSLALRDDQSPERALAALQAFPVAYQGAAVAGDQAARDDANLSARTLLLERALVAISEQHERPALASSLAAEDMVMTDAIARLKLPIDIFTLDTGRLHSETLALVPEVRRRYGLDVRVFSPGARAVAAYVAAHGRDGFYEGVAQRKLCCAIRKVAPLGMALEGRDAWITGQRRDQAVSRAALAEREHDVERGIVKYNPLAEWTWSDVLAYAGRYDIPTNALYARGYVSIGCEPCTKAVRPGDDPRSGRWWWEAQANKECGLHAHAPEAA